ncbi:MAG: HD domain-containing protein, partial [Lachnospiraceae bacterium]|nr:HD domain-containing protein [Lachnospiraceae bacterium]
MAFVYMELAATGLLLFDRLAYIYRGDVSELGYWMVRVSNFMVFFLTLAVVHSLNLFISDLLHEEVGVEKLPRRLIVAEVLASIGWFLIILSQFTGFYYVFDDQNRYQRGPGFLVCYIIPLLILGIHCSVVIQYYNRINPLMRLSLLLFTAIPIIASIIQVFSYGISLTNIATVGMSVVLYIFSIIEMNQTVERANRLEIEYLKEEKKNIQKLFEQTATAFATAINSKDQYTKGHSVRVADYSRRIAQIAGKDEKECEDIYYSALLHDVGKMGISDSIIKKDVGLTDEEYEILKEHPNIGGQILSPITDFPLLSVGAVYHHERYDGKGYPKGLKGEEIPEMARIISVADAYDAMTSKRSYRDPLPQSTVREELIKGSGTQLDPKFTNIMVNLIDQDVDYLMKEEDEDKNREKTDLSKLDQMHFDDYKEIVSDGLRLSSKITRIHFEVKPDKEFDAQTSIPTFILFDSYDGCVHKDDRSIRVLQYLEYAEIWVDGHVVSTAARNVKKTYSMMKDDKRLVTVGYDVIAVKYRDHVKVHVQSEQQDMDVVVALPDATKHAYLAITGEYCTIKDIRIENSEESIGEDYIGRIAEEISYIDRIE